ncbi:hypothetical protein [Deinococcus aquiradiocola]|uniref:hypothetical protein n=1 Tax=Deinococcus aquiradiocola TaxID=393059 RepID=UPI00166762EC|nr:hypothetical protein [Deinococcus aquiradiocola]
MSFAHAVPPLVRLLRDEAELVPDLLRARPWLAPGDAEAVLNAVLDSEWTGFVARLGRVGPWVYAPSVADLQGLSARYTALVQVTRAVRAAPDGRAGAPGAAARAGGPLAARLRAEGRSVPPDAAGLEDAFWRDAEGRAREQRDAWLARHSVRP